MNSNLEKSMNDMMTICKTTYARAMRTRSLYVLLMAVLVLVGVAHLYDDLSGGRQKELMYDVGAALLTVVGLFSALVVAFDIARDLRERVVMTLLSKPLGRSHYLLGKFLGVVKIGTVNLLILTIGILLLLKWEHGVMRWDFLKLAFSTWGMMVMTTAVGVLFASFFTELPAVILTVAVFALGHTTGVLYHDGSFISSLLFGVLPNFGLLDFKAELGNDLPISWKLITASVIYALAYCGALLSLANIIFHRRDIA